MIDHWVAWSSGLETPEGHFFYSQAQIANEGDAAKANVEFLPLKHRRRLSSRARAAFRVAHRCAEGNRGILHFERCEPYCCMSNSFAFGGNNTSMILGHRQESV